MSRTRSKKNRKPATRPDIALLKKRLLSIAGVGFDHTDAELAVKIDRYMCGRLLRESRVHQGSEAVIVEGGERQHCKANATRLAASRSDLTLWLGFALGVSTVRPELGEIWWLHFYTFRRRLRSWITEAFSSPPRDSPWTR